MTHDDGVYELRLTSAGVLEFAPPPPPSPDGLYLVESGPFWSIYRGFFAMECIARCTSEAAAIAARRLLQ